MRIKAHHALQPVVLEVTRVVVEDRYGNPLVAAVEYDDGTYFYGKLGDADFEPLLRMMGINKTVVITDLQTKPLSDVIWTP